MFRLQRYFTITSLVAFLLIALLLGYFFRVLAVSDLISASESKNVALTQTFANFLWPEFAFFVSDASEMDMTELQNHPRTQELYDLIQAQMSGLSVVKIKVYDLDGLTVFSTEKAQIGENKLDNAGYLAARGGEVASELTFRNTFSAFEQTIEDRNVFSSYVPIYGPGGDIEGVFEVYDDVTPLVNRLEQTQRTIILGVAVILFVLYGVLFLIVRRADGIIRQQYADLIRNEEELRVARDEALAASQFKSKLLASVSHEMRTPLHAIMGYAEILEQGVYGIITPKQRKATHSILSSSGVLLEFINNLLDRAQLESGKLVFKMKPLAPGELVEEIQAQVSVLAKANGLSLNCSVADDVPDRIMGDRYWLRQLMLNLLSNAIKFTHEGSVSLNLFKENEQWGFQVTDTGPGIPAEAQSRVFEAFEQGENEYVGSIKGIGLGLSIVREVVALLNGTIKLHSVPEQGTTFTITLPLLPLPVEKEVA
ncbi:MAG: HAMP domain-containing sensor histidine kinase [Chloroflexota bacterium]